MEVSCIFFAIIGACTGSFLNVVRWRLPRLQSLLYPGSYCDNCNREIKLLDKIPVVSWIILKGKCSFCKAKIDFKYPIIELLTAGLFVLNRVNYSYFYSDDLVISLFLICIFTFFILVIALIDLDTMKIPNEIILLASIIGLILLVINNSNEKLFIIQRILAAFTGLLAFESIIYILFLFSKKVAFGSADSKMFALLGIWLGFKGMFLCMLFSIYIAGLFSLVGLIFGYIKKNDKIPFAPFISTSSYLIVILGNNFWERLLLNPFTL